MKILMGKFFKELAILGAQDKQIKGVLESKNAIKDPVKTLEMITLLEKTKKNNINAFAKRNNMVN